MEILPVLLSAGKLERRDLLWYIIVVAVHVLVVNNSVQDHRVLMVGVIEIERSCSYSLSISFGILVCNSHVLSLSLYPHHFTRYSYWPRCEIACQLFSPLGMVHFLHLLHS